MPHMASSVAGLFHDESLTVKDCERPMPPLPGASWNLLSEDDEASVASGSDVCAPSFLPMSPPPPEDAPRPPTVPGCIAEVGATPSTECEDSPATVTTFALVERRLTDACGGSGFDLGGGVWGGNASSTHGAKSLGHGTGGFPHLGCEAELAKGLRRLEVNMQQLLQEETKAILDAMTQLAAQSSSASGAPPQPEVSSPMGSPVKSCLPGVSGLHKLPGMDVPAPMAEKISILSPEGGGLLPCHTGSQDGTPSPKESRSMEAKRESQDGDLRRHSSQVVFDLVRSNTRCEQPDLHPVRGFVRWLAQHRRFEVAVSSLIFCNALVIGIQADWAIKNVGRKPPKWITVSQTIFTSLFAIELIMRIIDEGSSFLKSCNKNLKWNAFDTFIVLSALFEWAAEKIAANTPDVSVIRILRVVRLFRIFRVLRVMRFFRELRTMVQGIMGSVRSLVWCLLLMCILIFLFGVSLLQLVTDTLAESAGSQAENAELLKYFGSLMRTVFTLFQTITGGVNWGETIDGMVNSNPMIAVAFSVYIAVAAFCVLNVVTGVFVENANAITRSDADNMVMEELSARERWMEEMRAVFELADKDGTGALDINEFYNYVQDVRVQAYFRKIGLNVEKDNARALFSLIDLDGNGVVELEEFVEGCAQFVGNARQLDIARLRRDNHIIAAELRELTCLLTGSAPPPARRRFSMLSAFKSESCR
mmetsp:Transcript_94234/g.272276  ORF Transcript_94234/g.272276 Transcript_94234/m.272276 type:complete len:704 (+) Transcript_94234:72-2183(+)